MRTSLTRDEPAWETTKKSPNSPTISSNIISNSSTPLLPVHFPLHFQAFLIEIAPQTQQHIIMASKAPKPSQKRPRAPQISADDIVPDSSFDEAEFNLHLGHHYDKVEKSSDHAQSGEGEAPRR